MLWLSVVVDEACTQIWEAWRTGASVTSLRVSPAVYTAVADARLAETARDYPLMLLGLPLVADREVATYAPVVVRKDVPKDKHEDVREDARKETPC